MPGISALEGWRKKDPKFKAILGYVVSKTLCKQARVLRDPVSKNRISKN